MQPFLVVKVRVSLVVTHYEVQPSLPPSVVWKNMQGVSEHL